MIPYVVHQLWLEPEQSAEGAAGLPKDISGNVASWLKYHPGVEHHVWQLNDLRNLLTDIEGMNVLEAVSVCRFPTMQSNLIRLALLCKFGGFWSDLKNVVQKPFLADLVGEDLVLTEHQPMKDPPPAGYLTNSFFGASSKHPFVILCLTKALEGVANRETGSLSKVTGLVLMNHVMKRAHATNTVPPHRLFARDDAWRVCMRRVNASYQSGNRHWSVLQKNQSLYLDDIGS
jgi:mannosyltransferase OCH1-like enzyme